MVPLQYVEDSSYFILIDVASKAWNVWSEFNLNPLKDDLGRIVGEWFTETKEVRIR